MLFRPMARANGATSPLAAGTRIIDNRVLVAVDGDNQAITISSILGGIVNRTGTTANTADTLPTVTSLLAAMPELVRGDSIAFSIRMVNAHTNTITVGTGMTAVGTVNIVASNIREYLLTLTSDNKQTVITQCTTTNASAVLSNVPLSALPNLGIGMAVTGTGIGAGAKIIAINGSVNGTPANPNATGTVTVSANSTATADNIAITATPQMDLLGVGTRAI